jgi:hypothetical protein
MESNINLVKASIVMSAVEDSTSVDRHLLIDNSEFVTLFKTLLNDNQDMQTITTQLKEFVANNY